MGVGYSVCDLGRYPGHQRGDGYSWCEVSDIRQRIVNILKSGEGFHFS